MKTEPGPRAVCSRDRRPRPRIGNHAAGARRGDAEKGKQVFNSQCRACHSLDTDNNSVGPSLHDVFGRKAGFLPSYDYSAAIKRSDVTWNEDALQQYLSNPQKFIPGGKMAFAGIKDQSQLDDLITYLNEASHGSASLRDQHVVVPVGVWARPVMTDSEN